MIFLFCFTVSLLIKKTISDEVNRNNFERSVLIATQIVRQMNLYIGRMIDEKRYLTIESKKSKIFNVSQRVKSIFMSVYL